MWVNIIVATIAVVALVLLFVATANFIVDNTEEEYD